MSLNFPLDDLDESLSANIVSFRSFFKEAEKNTENIAETLNKKDTKTFQNNVSNIRSKVKEIAVSLAKADSYLVLVKSMAESWLEQVKKVAGEVEYGDGRIFKTDDEMEKLEEIIETVYATGTSIADLEGTLGDDPVQSTVFGPIKHLLGTMVDTCQVALKAFEDVRDLVGVHDILATFKTNAEDDYELCVLTDQSED